MIAHPSKRSRGVFLSRLSMARLQALEKIADLARFMRQLEKELVRATDTRLVVDRLKDARQQLDEALEDLEQLERG